MVHIGMRMENTQWILGIGAVVAQYQIQLICLACTAADWSNGIVWLPIGLSQDAYCFITITSPKGQNMLCQVDELLAVLGGEPQGTHWPFYPACLYLWVLREAVLLLNWSLGHGKGIMSTLVVVMGQDGAAHDWQVRIGTGKVMWEDCHELCQVLKGLPGNLHWHMLTVEYDAVLVVVGIWGVLQEPAVAVEIQWNQAVGLAGRMVGMTGKALVFTAQETLWIAGGFY